MRISLSIIILIVFVSCKPKPSVPTENTLPNIVFILADDLGKEWISAYGAEDIETPNIDALAKSGTLFNNVYAMPQCTPSRLTILTGQYPFRHGWVNHWDVPRWGGGAHFDENLNPSLGIEMKKAGYNTCIAGKWQIDDFRVEPDALTRNGFDEYCMWTGYESGNDVSAERYQNPYIFTKEGSKTYKDGFGPDIFTNYITDFIDNNKNDPFFVYYPMVLPHTPLVNTPDEQADNNTSKHKAMVRYMDKLTGKIIKSLEDANVRENTLIIWTTDNGSTRGVSGSYKGNYISGGKAKTSENGICIPFIASWPEKLKSGQTSDALIDFSDFFPTFLDLAGIAPKTKWKVGNQTQQIDGKSFKEVLVNNLPKSKRNWILSMGGGNNAKLTKNGVENQFRFRDRVIRNERYKLCINSQNKPNRFYDLAIDPFEKNNIIDSLNTADRKKNYNTLLTSTNSFPVVDNDPRYIPNPKQKWDVSITAESGTWKK